MVLGVKNLPANAGDSGDSSSILGQGTAPWRRKWHPTPVFLPGESLGQRRLVGSSPLWKGHDRLSILTDFGRREKEGRDVSGKESRSGRKDEGGDDRERTPRQDVSRNYTTCHFHSLRNQTVCGQLYLSKAEGGDGCVYLLSVTCACVCLSLCLCVCLNMYLCVHIPACLDKSVCVWVCG